ncbi:MAG: DUF4091 domain-containing protein [Leptospirales bacterium]
MRNLSKGLLKTFFGLGIFVIGLIAFFYALSPESAKEFNKKGIIHSIGAYHPLGHIKTAVSSIKSLIKKDQTAGATETGFSDSPGFSGSRAENSGSLLSWISPFSDRIPPGIGPPKNRIHSAGTTRPLVVLGLRGETLSFQLVLHSEDPVSGLMVRLIPDPSLEGSKCIHIHRFLEYYLKTDVHVGSKYGPIREIVTPDPLIPFRDPYRSNHRVVPSIALSSGINQPVWLDVRFARSCAPGHYKGTLEVRRDAHILRSSRIAFEVLPAILPRRVPLDRWMELYIHRLWVGERIPDAQTFQTILYRYFKLAHKYGFATNPSGDFGPGISWDWKTGKALSVNWDQYDRIYDPLLSGKLTGQTPNEIALPIPIESLGVGWWGGFMIEGPHPSPIGEWNGIPDIATRQLAKIIVQHWQDKGWKIENTFAYPFDEPMHKLPYYGDIYRLIHKSAQSLHEGSDHKIRFMLTDVPWVWDKHQKGHHKSAMMEDVDIWAPGAELYIPDRIASIQQKGKRSWFYQSGPPFIGGSDLSSSGIGFRMWFWAAWKYHSNGVFYWVSDFYHGTSKDFNPYYKQGSGDGVVFYPGRQLHFIGYPDVDGPIPSIRMAQWRRGYEDYKYFVLLKEKSDGEMADRTVNALVHKALDDGGYLPYWRNPLWWKAGDWSHDSRVWHRARIRLAKKIAALYSVPPGK